MTRLAYFDCPAGASGDMILGALVDAGLPVEALAEVVTALGLADEVTVRAERVTRRAIAATKVHVEARPDSAAPPTRHLADILARIDAAALPPAVKAGAGAVFRRLAEAEAGVHGTGIDEVHFHEVGALDAMVDVVGAVAGLAALGVESTFCSPLPAGSGWVDSAHGPLPVPAPATLALLALASAPVAAPPGGAERPGELVTPTGAAILTTLGCFGRPAMSLERVGTGAGGRDRPWPNVLRLWLGESVATEAGEVVVLEANIDDMLPELYGHIADRLFAAGALDVWLTPIQMKKGRPGTLLSVLAPAAMEGDLAGIVLAETTTLGLRVTPARRHVAERTTRIVDTPYGPLPVKVKLAAGRPVAYAPEYEACRQAALAAGVPLAEVYEAVRAAAQEPERSA